MTQSEPEMVRESPLEEGRVPRLEVPGWRREFGLVAGITTRGTPDAPWDLGLTSDRPVGTVLGQWAAFRGAETGFPLVTLGRQVHAAEIAWHEGGRGWLMLDGVDGHATAAPGVLLTVTVADCVPIYLADPVTGALALLHAGWRGASSRILERGVRLLTGRAGTSVENIVMHCGVGICGNCYEVGSEVFEAFGLERPTGGKGQLDVREQIVRQAGDLGIERVSVSAWCSGHDSGLFHSHRRSKGRDGRMIAYLGRPVHASN
jgi:YfiH family protein